MIVTGGITGDWVTANLSLAKTIVADKADLPPQLNCPIKNDFFTDLTNDGSQGYLTIFPQYHMGPKAEWAINSEAMRARGIIVLVKSN